MSKILYIGVELPYEEKSAWIMLVLAVGTYAGYAAVVWRRARHVALTDVAYVSPMLWAIGISILLSIIAHIVIGAFSPKGEDRKDQRDREIGRFGEYTGQSFLVIGAIAALGLAMAEVEYFWIANVLALAFFLSAVVGSMAKLSAYRVGLPRW